MLSNLIITTLKEVLEKSTEIEKKRWNIKDNEL